jgi:hypothetical protein
MGEETTKATRYLIYETDDSGRTLHLAGEIDDYGSEPARRHWFATQPSDREGTFTAVSENAMRLIQRRVEKNPKVVLEEVAVPKSSATAELVESAEGPGADGEVGLAGAEAVEDEIRLEIASRSASGSLSGNDEQLAPAGASAS